MSEERMFIEILQENDSTWTQGQKNENQGFLLKTMQERVSWIFQPSTAASCVYLCKWLWEKVESCSKGYAVECFALKQWMIQMDAFPLIELVNSFLNANSHCIKIWHVTLAACTVSRQGMFEFTSLAAIYVYQMRKAAGRLLHTDKACLSETQELKVWSRPCNLT